MKTLETINREIEALRAELETVEGTETEIYTRIVGYYRSVRNWNRGKREEYGKRRLFNVDKAFTEMDRGRPVFPAAGPAMSPDRNADTAEAPWASYTLFYRAACPNCPPVKSIMDQVSAPGLDVNVDTDDGMTLAAEHSIYATPTVTFHDEDGTEVFRATDAVTLSRFLAGAGAPAGQPA